MKDEAPRGDEADIPAGQARAQAPARLPRADGDGGRPQGPGPPPSQGPRQAERLSVLRRLTRRPQFLFVQKGFKAARASASVEARRRAPDGVIGVGFTATKRLGGAVIRNRAKRRLREAARVLLPSLGEPGVDYVFVARPGALSRAWPALLDDLRNALIRLRADLRAEAPSPSTESD